MPVSAASTGPSRLLRMTEGMIAHEALCVVADLGVADVLGDGPRDVSEIAAALGVNQEALYRVLRFLTGQGVFCERADGQFANNGLSEWLRGDAPGSVRRVLMFRGSRYFTSALTSLRNVIATGTPAHDAFERLRRDPDEARVFDDAMTDISAVWAPSIAGAYNFGKWDSLTDVGGGNGLLLAMILRAHSELRGVLADQPHVLARALKCDFWRGLEDRVRFEPMDFFQSVPPGARAYLMKNVLHDWNDELALRILKNCRRAVPRDGVLLLVEYSLGPENAPSLGKAVDIIMLTSTGGRERTIREHRALLAVAEFQLSEVIHLEGDVLILEAKPAAS